MPDRRQRRLETPHGLPQLRPESGSLHPSLPCKRTMEGLLHTGEAGLGRLRLHQNRPNCCYPTTVGPLHVATGSLSRSALLCRQQGADLWILVAFRLIRVPRCQVQCRHLQPF